MAARRDPLAEYNKRRDFKETREPRGSRSHSRWKRKRFLVQKHDATRLHYDFRLEWDGVLKSWAVTRGPSLNRPDHGRDRRGRRRTEETCLGFQQEHIREPQGRRSRSAVDETEQIAHTLDQDDFRGATEAQGGKCRDTRNAETGNEVPGQIPGESREGVEHER